MAEAAAPLHDPLQPQLEHGLAMLQLEPALAPPLLRYLRLLARWNATYNLTAVREPREMLTLHLLDSLAMHPHLAGVRTLADLGSGAGLPGIPLAIALPDLQVTLVESSGKKARFLREAVRQLTLANVRVAESRIEALDEAAAFDAITARALAGMAQILRLGGHLLRADGRLLALKGTFPEDEVAALPPGWAMLASHALAVPGLDAQRHLVVVARRPGNLAASGAAA